MIEDRQEFQRKLLPKDLISESDVDDAIVSWFEKRTDKKSEFVWNQDMVGIVKRLSWELFIPAMDAGLNANTQLWKIKGTAQNELYTQILDGFEGRDINRLCRAAWGISNTLAKEAKRVKRTIVANGHTVPGDSELTDPKRGVAGVGGRSPYDMEPDANPNGLGYIQSSRENN